MSLKTTTKKFLTIAAATGLTAIGLSVVPSTSKASELNMPTCPKEGSGNRTINYIGSTQNGFCLLTPEKYELTIYEMGLCTSNPITGSTGSLVYDKTNCTPTMTMAGGKTVDLAGSSTATLPAGSKPPSASYNYAYILISNKFTLKGSYTLDNGTTYYSTPQNEPGWGEYGKADSTIAASQEHNETLDDLGFGASWSGEMSAQSMSGGGKVAAILLQSDGTTKATGRANVARLLGAFETNSGSPVVIKDSTKGLEVSLKVTDSGYGMMLNDTGTDIEEFGSAPFKPEFKTW